MTEEMVEVSVDSLGVDRATGTPVVILKESHGSRILPIWIGPGEASAIAMALSQIEFPRPLTHDLLAAVVRGLGALVRVQITQVKENTYFASLIFAKEEEFITVDARPSDSVALALRTRSPIFAQEALMELPMVDVSRQGFDEGEDPTEEAQASPQGGASVSSEGPLSQASAEEVAVSPELLRRHLRDMDPEALGRFDP